MRREGRDAILRRGGRGIWASGPSRGLSCGKVSGRTGAFPSENKKEGEGTRSPTGGGRGVRVRRKNVWESEWDGRAVGRYRMTRTIRRIPTDFVQRRRRGVLRDAQQVRRPVARGAVRDAPVAPRHAADGHADAQPAHGQHLRQLCRHGARALLAGDQVRLQRVQLRKRVGCGHGAVEQAAACGARGC